MTTTLTDLLQTEAVDPALVPHAMRYFVSAQTGDLPPERMHEDLLAAGVDADRAQKLLAEDARLLETASLAILQAGWEDLSSRETVEGALSAAGSKLPVVEVALIAIVAVYGMWLIATKGRRSERTMIRHRADGSWEEERVIEWYGASDPLRAIASMFGGGVDSAPDGETPELTNTDDAQLPPGSS